MKRTITLLLCCLCLSILSLQAAIPEGYYHVAEGKSGAELKSALSAVCGCVSLVRFGSGSGSTWEAFYELDRKSDGSVRDRYSNELRYFDASQPGIPVEGMHIEHAMAKSWWAGYDNDANSDLHHLFPVDGTTNVTKNYHPLGVVGVPTFDNGVSKLGNNVFPGASGVCFEPADEYKGDFARAYLYMSTKYEDMYNLWQSAMMNNNVYPVWNDWSRELLLQWNRQDPVSAEEQARNEKIFVMQGNRNPFVDYPDLAEHIWGADTLVGYQFPAVSGAYLYAPHCSVQLDFGGVAQNSTHTLRLALGGANLTSNVVLSFKNNSAGLSLSSAVFDVTAVMADTAVYVTFVASVAGVLLDTLLISQGGLSQPVAVPISGVVSSEYLLTSWSDVVSNKGTVHWVAVPGASGYLVDVYEGDSIAGDLFIYYYKNSGVNSAVGIYNGTAGTVDLSKYTLCLQRNGVGEFSVCTPLNGLLPRDSCYVLANALSTDVALLASADSLVNGGSLDFDGNDALALYRSGVLIDVLGVIDESRGWGVGVTMERNSYVTHPHYEFRWDEWLMDDYVAGAVPRGHVMLRATRLAPEVTDELVVGRTSYDITGLHPRTYYTSKVRAMVGNDTILLGNTLQFRSGDLDIPYAMDATHITHNSFYANWDDVAGAMSYKLSVFTLTKSGMATEMEGFDDVLSVGRPLPEGWSSNAYGTFQDSLYVGVSAPAMMLSEANDYLQSRNYPAPVESMSFMYCFPQNVRECRMVVEAGYSEKFEPIDTIYSFNTNKNIKSYTFSESKGYRSFRWIFTDNKGSATLSLDDVEVTYAESDTTFHYKNRETTVTNFNVLGVTEGEQYYYHVKAHFCHLSSAYSNVIAVTPRAPLGDVGVSLAELWFYTQPEGIMLMDVQPGSVVTVCSVSGVCLWRGKAAGSELLLPITERGIYVIQVISARGMQTLKVMR